MKDLKDASEIRIVDVPGIMPLLFMKNKKALRESYEQHFIIFYPKYYFFYFRSFFKQVWCVLWGHKSKWQEYPNPRQRFKAYECNRCGVRFAVKIQRMKWVDRKK